MEHVESDMKKFISKLVVFLFICLLFLVIPNIEAVKATETVYIRADGGVDPITAPIQRDGDIYTFTDNIYASIVVERDNIVLDGLGYTIQGTGSGIGIDVTAVSGYMKVTIKNVEIKEFTIGIALYSFNEGIIAGNMIKNNRDGLRLAGLGQFSSFGNTISGNTIANNENGIVIEGYVVDNIISENTISNNNCGITIVTFMPLHSPAKENIVSGNTITNNGKGIYLDGSPNNFICHNDFVDNIDQVYAVNSVNAWDDGFPCGGNYWSDYTGIDANGDGIGDSPYIIDENNKDNYPLMDQLNISTLPEFQSLILLSLFLIATLVVIVYRKNLTKKMMD